MLSIFVKWLCGNFLSWEMFLLNLKNGHGFVFCDVAVLAFL